MIRINSNISYMDGIQIRVWSRQLKQLYINWNISWGLLVCFIQKFQTAIRYFYSYSFLKVTMLNKENCPANEKKRYNIWKELLASINCKIVNSIALIKNNFYDLTGVFCLRNLICRGKNKQANKEWYFLNHFAFSWNFQPKLRKWNG